MGIVVRARHADDGRVVALKVLRDELQHDAAYRRRLAREARAAAEVDHPNLAGVLEVGEADGRSYLVVRYVDGAAGARQGPPPAPADRDRVRPYAAPGSYRQPDLTVPGRGWRCAGSSSRTVLWPAAGSR
jgi:hypothetical protein